MLQLSSECAGSLHVHQELLSFLYFLAGLVEQALQFMPLVTSTAALRCTTPLGVRVLRPTNATRGLKCHGLCRRLASVSHHERASVLFSLIKQRPCDQHRVIKQHQRRNDLCVSNAGSSMCKPLV